MDAIQKNENFFVEGSGKAVVAGESGKLEMIHLQDMDLELSSKMEDIFGGESNMPIYQYQSEKGVKAKFTNASMSLALFNLSQGVTSSKSATIFKNEDVVVGADGSIKLTEATADLATLIVSEADGTVVPVVDGKVDKTLAATTVSAFYNYTTTVNAIGSDVLTTSIPGYAQIFHTSKPIKQKNGRIVRIYTTIYKARCDGAFKLNLKHKSAFAPEITFNAADPERADKKFLSITVVDVTDAEKNNANVVVPADSKQGA